MFKENYLDIKETKKKFDLSILAVNSNSYTKKELLRQLLEENIQLKKLLTLSSNKATFNENIKNRVLNNLKNKPKALAYYNNNEGELASLTWKDIAAIRILDYIDHTGESHEDLFLHGKEVYSKPFDLVWDDFNNIKTDSNNDFYIDIIALFRQYNGSLEQTFPNATQMNKWMDRFPSGLEQNIIDIQTDNKINILKKIIKKIDEGEYKSNSYYFEEGLSQEEKLNIAMKWWETSKFHLVFAFRTPEIIDEMTNHTLDKETLNNMYAAKKSGIPFFINPYYLSLLLTKEQNKSYHIDATLRDYMFVSKGLVEEFGQIKAWEKEDIVEPGKPNTAGWILPTKHNLHRRYPEVAILIPDTVGRACGGLCVSCQRMYDFQRGHLNFNLKKLKPKKQSWETKLKLLMDYFENDSQLRDILITGGDALMSSDSSLKKILDAVYNMAIRKREANKTRPSGEKYAEIVKVRLGTRLPVYIPQRITPELIKILKDFKHKASKIGIKQFVIQTHFISPLEVTPLVKKSVEKLISAGWLVYNQLVYTTSASRRGHTTKLRKILNDIGIITYYTFSVKGYLENKHNFATNARSVQEKIEEKNSWKSPACKQEYFQEISNHPEKIKDTINSIRDKFDIPFLATDRNVLNLPGLGKSLSFRVIGITNTGRRILQFSHDESRLHSPIIKKQKNIIIIESKTISELLRQLKQIGEDTSDYTSIYGYSASYTEKRIKLFEYPDYDYEPTKHMTNLKIQ